MQKKLRRFQHTLIYSAQALIAFSFWNVLKNMILYLSFWEELKDKILEIFPSSEQASAAIIIGYVVLLLIGCTDLLFRIYVGRSAILYVKGKKKRFTYFYVSVIYFLICLFSAWGALRGLYESTNTMLDKIFTTIIEITSLYVFAELIYASFRMKRLIDLK